MNMKSVPTDKITQAMIRAEEEHLVAVRENGFYAVVSKGNVYRIILAPPDISCNCEAAKHSLLCKHIGALLNLLAEQETLELIYGL